MTNPPVLIVPGRGNSEPEHWQSILESSILGAIRVEQSWNDTDIDIWSANIDQAVAQLDRPPLIIAHSFGCLATAYAQIKLGTLVGATLFVAPADPARFGLNRSRFAKKLPRSGIIVVSQNDPWLTLEGALSLAQSWGMETINAGRSGHINVASGHGYWPFAHTLVETMRSDLAAIQSVNNYSMVRPDGARPVFR